MSKGDWVFVIFLVSALLSPFVFITVDAKVHEKRYKFQHDCVLDQGISASSENDFWCIYPKESKIKRFE